MQASRSFQSFVETKKASPDSFIEPKAFSSILAMHRKIKEQQPMDALSSFEPHTSHLTPSSHFLQSTLDPAEHSSRGF